VPVGVISHLPNPAFDDVRRLAEAAERAGADWLGLPDAFWWRDTWLLLGEVARVTLRIGIGPLVTNPYLRHPFHTVAALASLQDLAGERVFIGIGAGGSEVSGAARISRRDAPERIRSLVSLLRSVERGEPLDAGSGRRLELTLRHVPVLIAGRGDRILKLAGECADSALLWAIPQSDLARSRATVASGAQASPAEPELVWAPLVDYGGQSRERVGAIAAYSVLNSHPSLHDRWGLDRSSVIELRRRLVGGGAAAARELVPAVALDDLILGDASPAAVGSLAASVGATSLAVPAFSIDEVEPRVAWAQDVLRAATSLAA
jgi:alkanesulfonate monooxygenase SsuD/methylene tetrahydromethanopterin reductase-like flavin-dependent oxidoreductase (luciferase family)